MVGVPSAQAAGMKRGRDAEKRGMQLQKMRPLYMQEEGRPVVCVCCTHAPHLGKRRAMMPMSA